MKTYRPLFVFYFLILYIFASYLWWAYLLYKKNEDIYHERKYIIEHHIHKDENGMSVAQLEADFTKQKYMILGEGFVFIALIALGVWQIRSSFTKEIQLNRQQNNFLLSITHELKSPLAAIQLSLQTMLKQNATESQKNKLTKNSLQDVERLKALVENILIATKVETEEQHFAFEEINISEYIMSMLREIKTSKENITFIVKNFKEDCYINGDPIALGLIISNLIENASKYAPSESPIEISLWEESDKVHFSVGDFGAGIPDAEKKNIFKKFYRIGNEETRNSKGTGLGLYLVKQLVSIHQGQVSVQDNIPHGSVFHIKFPL